MNIKYIENVKKYRNKTTKNVKYILTKNVKNDIRCTRRDYKSKHYTFYISLILL